MSVHPRHLLANYKKKIQSVKFWAVKLEVIQMLRVNCLKCTNAFCTCTVDRISTPLPSMQTRPGDIWVGTSIPTLTAKYAG